MWYLYNKISWTVKHTWFELMANVPAEKHCNENKVLRIFQVNKLYVVYVYVVEIAINSYKQLLHMGCKESGNQWVIF